MNLQSYLKLTSLIHNDTSTKENRRAFALENNLEGKTKINQLLFWMHHAKHIPNDTPSHLHTVSGVVFFLAFLFGTLTATALLSYSGKEPVNSIYFLAIAVMLPLLSMFLSLVMMGMPKYVLPFSLGVWLQKLVAKLLYRQENSIKVAKSVQIAFAFFVMQMSGLLFSLGLLLAFLGIIFTQDIAFGWSSTLDITTQSFYNFLHTLSFAFEHLCPQSVVSLELIEQSRYFRLGQTVTQEMQNNAEVFGHWWQFLACSTFFYAIVLRLFFVGMSVMLLRSSIEKAFLRIEGVKHLLQDMNEPIISTVAQEQEDVYIEPLKPVVQTLQTAQYFAVLGWVFTSKELLLAQDARTLTAQHTATLGGQNSLEEDSATIEKMQGDVVLFIKAWEVPTMEFIDTVEELLEYVTHLYIYPLGYPSQEYKPKEEDVMIWKRKVAVQNFENVSFL